MDEQNSIPTGILLFNAAVIDEETKQGVRQMLQEGASDVDIHAVYPCYEGYVQFKAPLNQETPAPGGTETTRER